MEETPIQHGKMESDRRIMALERALALSLEIIKDISYHNRHSDRDYLNLITEFLALTSGLLRDDE